MLCEVPLPTVAVWVSPGTWSSSVGDDVRAIGGEDILRGNGEVFRWRPRQMSRSRVKHQSCRKCTVRDIAATVSGDIGTDISVGGNAGRGRSLDWNDVWSGLWF